MVRSRFMKHLLTTHLGRRSECCRHLRIHGYVEDLITLHCLIAFLDPITNPTTEYALKECRAHVAYPLFGDLVDFLGVGEVVKDLLVAIVQEGRDVLQS